MFVTSPVSSSVSGELKWGACGTGTRSFESSPSVIGLGQLFLQGQYWDIVAESVKIPEFRPIVIFALPRGL